MTQQPRHLSGVNTCSVCAVPYIVGGVGGEDPPHAAPKAPFRGAKSRKGGEKMGGRKKERKEGKREKGKKKRERKE